MHIASMVQWLHCSTRIDKILRSNISIINLEMTLDKSLIANLSRMAHSYCASVSTVSTLDGRGADTAVGKEKDSRN